jgi:hypothetical protein
MTPIEILAAASATVQVLQFLSQQLALAQANGQVTAEQLEEAKRLGLLSDQKLDGKMDAAAARRGSEN